MRNTIQIIIFCIISTLGIILLSNHASASSNPDIVVKNITIASPIYANQATSVNVTLNVSNYNFGAWNVNVSLWNVTKRGLNINSWIETKRASTSISPRSVVINDMNSDGYNDIVLATYNETHLYQNPANGSSGNISAWSYSKNNVTGKVVKVADMDNDGDNDVVSINGSNIYIFNNPGNMNINTWQRTNTSLPNELWSLGIGDMDNDGDIDIAVGENMPSDANIYTLKNPGNLNISSWTRSSAISNSRVTEIDVGDIDSDGDNDIISTHYGNRVYLWNNSGDANISTWSSTYKTVSSSYVEAATMADMDNDGDNDVVAGGGAGGRLYVLENPGSSNITAWNSFSTIPLGGDVHTVSVADMDNDGDNDVVIDSFFGVSIYENLGSLNLDSWNYSYNPNPYSAMVMDTGDMDNDGDNDVVLGNIEGRMYLNQDITSTFIASDVKVFTNATREEKTYSFTWTPTSIGSHTLVAIAGIGGRYSEVFEWNNQFAVTRLVKSTNPITIHLPPSITSDTTPVLNATVELDNPGSMWYSVDGGINVSGGWTNNIYTDLSALSDGSHYVTVYANNSTGSEFVAINNFIVDTIPPVISINSPQNATVNTTTLNATQVEANPGSMWYSVDGGMNYTGWTNSIYTNFFTDQYTAGLWHFDNDIYDSSSNGNNATAYNTAWVDGKIGSALRFDSINDYVKIPDHPSLDLTAEEGITIQAWINPSSISSDYYEDYIISKGRCISSPYGFAVHRHNETPVDFIIAIHGKDRSEFYGHAQLNYQELANNTWHNIAVVYTKTEKKVYLNGNLRMTTNGHVVYRNDEPVIIGQRNCSLVLQSIEDRRRFNGTIDEVRILRKALTQQEIRQNYTLINGSHYVTVYSTDAAGNSNSITTYFTFNSASGRLSPFSIDIGEASTPTTTTPTTEEKPTTKITSIAPYSPATIDTTETNTAVSEITIYVDDLVTNVGIGVQKLEKPVGLPALADVYSYLNITKENIFNENITKVKIKFKVEKSWIAANDIDEEKVALNRYADNKWNKLTTIKVNSDATYVYYEAETTALSVFAITGEKKVEVAPAVKECPACPSPSAWNDCVNNKQTRTNYRCSVETNYECQSYSEEKGCVSERKLFLWIAGGIIAILIGVGTFYLKRKRITSKK